MKTEVKIKVRYAPHSQNPVTQVWVNTFDGALPCVDTLIIGDCVGDLSDSWLRLTGPCAEGVLVLTYRTSGIARDCMESDAIAFSRLGFTQEPT